MIYKSLFAVIFLSQLMWHGYIPEVLNKPVTVSLESSLDEREEIVRIHDEIALNKKIDFSFSSLENSRGKDGISAYKNQDRAFIGSYNDRICIGVFDGHGAKTGGIVSEFVRNNLPRILFGYRFLQSGMYSACSWIQNCITVSKKSESECGGTTAILGVVEGSKLTIANVGDSRAVGVLKGKTTQLSHDHNVDYPLEKKRVKKAGGVIFNGYVCVDGRGLAVTRSFGDLPFHKNNVVTATPEIKTFTVQAGDKLIFASDGLWDVMSNEEVVTFLKKHSINDLVKKARELGSKDDITVAVAIIK